MPYKRKVFEGEMTDILEGGYLCAGRDGFIDKVVEENIEEVLRRNGILERDWDVVIPVGALSDVNCSENFYQYDFQVMDEHDNIVFAGTAYGRLNCDESKYRRTGDECDIVAEILDMTVELYK